MKKKMISALLTMGMIVGLTACSGGASEEGTGSGDEIVLEFPSWQATEPGFQEFWEAAVEEFESTHENVKINLYQVPFDSYVDTLTTLYAADTPPQITHIPSRYFAQFSEMGWFEPLNNRLEETDIIENWSSLQEGLQTDGEYYGVLLLGNGYTLYYNKAMFDEAGLEVPTDAESFMEAAEKLTIDENGDGDPEIFGFGTCQVTDTNFYNEASQFVVGMGGKWCENGDLSAMTSEETIQGLEMYQSLFENKWTPIGLSEEQKRQYFVEGKMAMIFDGPWVASLIEDASEDIKDDLLATRIPFENVPGSMSNSLHIPASISDEEKDLVWEFIQMVSGEEFQQLYMKDTSSPSPNKQAVNDEILKENPFMDQFSKDAEEAQEILPSGYEKDYGEFSQFVIDAVMKMTTEPYADVEDTLNELKTQVTEELSE